MTVMFRLKSPDDIDTFKAWAALVRGRQGAAFIDLIRRDLRSFQKFCDNAPAADQRAKGSVQLSTSVTLRRRRTS